MRRLLLLIPIALAPLVAFAGGETEIMEIDPLAEKNLHHFATEGEAEWGIDDKSHVLYTYITCRDAKSDSSLVFKRRTFSQGFRLTIEVLGGSKGKNLETYVFPPEGERIRVPFKKRWLAKKGWHELVLTVEDGKAWVRIDDDEDERVAVPTDKDLTFALTVKKRGEGTFRKPKILFLVVSQDQKKPEEGFVRIFDGKSLDGWKTGPEGVKNFELKGQMIEGRVPMSQEQNAELYYADGAFRDFELRMSVALGARNLLLIGRPPAAEGGKWTYTSVEGYFPGDRDWNDVEWIVKGKQVALRVNGSERWSTTAPSDRPHTVHIIVGRDGHAKIRDIRVRGRNINPGPSWAKYVKESGGGAGGGPAAAGNFGGRGNNQPSAGGEQEKKLFNGKDLYAPDWRKIGNPSVWSTYDGRVVGTAQGQKSDSILYYGKLIYSDYRLTFKVQRESHGAKFLARLLPPGKDGKAQATVTDIPKEWINQDEPWTEFDVEVWGTDLQVTAGGKVVHKGKVPPDAGFFGWVLPPGAAIGVMDIVWHRPKRR